MLPRKLLRNSHSVRRLRLSRRRTRKLRRDCRALPTWLRLLHLPLLHLSRLLIRISLLRESCRAGWVKQV